MPHLQIRNVPDNLHKALQNWVKENHSSVSALILNQLKQQIQLRKFEKALRKLLPTDTSQETINSLHAERDE